MPGNQMKRQQPKEAAANRGCLSARQWSDFRQAMRLTRSEGGVLILHGVKVLSSDDAASESLLQSFQQAKNSTRDARKPPQTEAVTEAGASTSKRLHAQQRSAQRLADYNEAKRVLPPAAPDGSRSYRQSFLASREAARRSSGLRGCAPRWRLARSCATSSCVSEWRRPHLEYKAPKPPPPGWQRSPTATTFSPRSRTATGTSSTVPRTSLLTNLEPNRPVYQMRVGLATPRVPLLRSRPQELRCEPRRVTTASSQ